MARRRPALGGRGAADAQGLGPIERNLAWRAAEAYAAATGWPNDWAIDIDKRIPVGGGLGGGSADGAAVLRCLNALAPEPLSGDALLSLAAALGADVPFLATDAPLALAWGRGERMLKLPALDTREVALVAFPFGVVTRDAYGWLDQVRDAVGPAATAFARDDLATWAGVARSAHNDFESVVAARVPEIATTLAALRSTIAAGRDPDAFALLAGSGATVFLLAATLPAGDLGAHGVRSRTLRTRTADRVVAVEVSA